MRLSCKACGGGLRPDDERCGLCGTPAGVDPLDLERVAFEVKSEASVGAVGGQAAVEAPTTATDWVFCNSCGWKNPGGSRFCSQCGATLQSMDGSVTPSHDGHAGASADPAPDSRLPPARVEHGPSVEEGVGKRVAIIVGAAVLIVVTLFMIGALNNSGEGAQAPVALSPDDFAPVPSGIASQIEALDDSVAQSTGEARLTFMSRRVELFVSAARYDLAGEAQLAVAGESDTEDNWTLAGNLFYDSMDRAAEGSGDRTGFAKRAIAAYREVLRINDDNLDVRTDMAVAYLYDPDNPMSAIQETQAVLERDSLHVQANFNRGIMLLQINRVDGALEQFRKVQRIVGDPGDPIYVRAQEAIDTVSGQG
jgi:zinc-ribbon domain